MRLPVVRFGKPPHPPLAWWEVPFLPVVFAVVALALAGLSLLAILKITFRAMGLNEQERDSPPAQTPD